MLNLWVKGFRSDCITIPGKYFDTFKKKDWFNREDVKQVIKEIDNTDVIKDEYLESPVFGGISPERLSHGCKTTILLYVNPTCNAYISRCGDNCVPSILRLADRIDVIATLHHYMNFPADIHAKFLDSGVEVFNRRGFYDEYSRLISTK